MAQDQTQMTDADILAAAKRVGEEVLLANAQETDASNSPNVANMRAIAEARLLGLGAPKEYGGLDATPLIQREVSEVLASYCGVTTFTQAQHHGPTRMIANCPNERLRQKMLPLLASGEKMCGVSFAHLRRPGAPILRAEPVEGGYRLQGTAPWVTGWGFMEQFVFGAALPDGRFVYLWTPVRREDFSELFADVAPPRGEWGEMIPAEAPPLCAMQASATVVLTLKDWFVPQAHWMQESDSETMRRNDRSNALTATAMPLGCAAASVRLLCETAEKRGIAAIRRASDAFQREWSDAKAQANYWTERQGASDFAENALRVRAWCIELASRAALAAVTANSGAANLRSHPAQRLLREAMFYAVQAQTQDVLDATLARLER